ncbi:MAG: hypothetical protein PHN56_03345, partial [Candidatus Nanoarchaeia archaeon]|nr:hypothetical protein [Candidatus Nanoarchaeia archaeon]
FNSISNAGYSHRSDNITFTALFSSLSIPNYCKINLGDSWEFMQTASNSASFSKIFPVGNYSIDYQVSCNLINDYTESSLASFNVGNFVDYIELEGTGSYDEYLSASSFDVFMTENNAYIFFRNESGIYLMNSSDNGKIFSAPLFIFNSSNYDTTQKLFKYYADDISAYVMFGNGSGLWLINYSLNSGGLGYTNFNVGDFSSSNIYSFEKSGDNINVVYSLGDGIYLINSSNNGADFSSPSHVYSSSYLSPLIHIKSVNNYVYIIFNYISSETRKLYIIQSNDYGLTFSEPVELGSETERTLSFDVNEEYIHLIYRLQSSSDWNYVNSTHSEFNIIPQYYMTFNPDSVNLITNNSGVYIFDHLLYSESHYSNNNASSFDISKISKEGLTSDVVRAKIVDEHMLVVLQKIDSSSSAKIQGNLYYTYAE